MAATVKNLVAGKAGVEFEVRSAAGEFLGDFIVTGTGVTWCKGRTSRENGKTVNWGKFIKIIAEVDNA